MEVVSVYSILIILVLSWIGLVLCGIIKALNQGVALKKEEQGVRYQAHQLRIQHWNANLKLFNDLHVILKLVYKNYFQEKEPEMRKFFIFCNGIFSGVYYGQKLWEDKEESLIQFYIDTYENLGLGSSDPVTVIEQKDFGEFKYDNH